MTVPEQTADTPAAPPVTPSAGAGPAPSPVKQILFFGAVAAAMLLLTYGVYLSFFVAPTEMVMGFVQKIFYFHVPAAWIMFLAVFIGAGASISFLATKSDRADRLAHSCIELGALFGIMVLVTGPLWGYKAWGTPWVWDVRLTSSLLLELVLLAYLLVRAFAGPGARSLAAGLAIFGVVQIPLIYYSVDIWRGTHPPRLVAEGGLHADMRTALYVCFFGFAFLFSALLAARLSVGRAAARLDELHLLAEEADLPEP
jgi:heme exporter protein C